MNADQLLEREAEGYRASTFRERQFRSVEWEGGRLDVCLYERTWTPPLDDTPRTELRVAVYLTTDDRIQRLSSYRAGRGDA